MKIKLLHLHLLLPLFAFAQIQQIGEDIDGEAEFNESGTSVSLSADGSIVAIGAPYNIGSGGGPGDPGHVRVYQNIGGYMDSNWRRHRWRRTVGLVGLLCKH